MSAPATLSPSLGLLVRQEIIDAIRTGMQARSPGSDLLVFLLATFAFVALLVLAKLYYAREHRLRTAPRRNNLAAAAGILGLTARERADLQRLIARARPAQPVALLLSPTCMARAIARGLPAEDDPELYARLQALAHKLFTDSPPTT